ncbi:MAG: hypothetical protein ACTSRG_25370 [Candidatus Helarchaeota archaeon]
MKKRGLTRASSFKLPYRKKIQVAQLEEFMEVKLPWAEIEALIKFKTSEGYLKDFFLLNEWRFRNQPELTRKQEEFFGRFFIGNLTKLEIGRYKLEYAKFVDWVGILESDPNLISLFDLENEQILDISNYGRLVINIGSSNLRAFHGLLVG